MITLRDAICNLQLYNSFSWEKKSKVTLIKKTKSKVHEKNFKCTWKVLNISFWRGEHDWTLLTNQLILNKTKSTSCYNQSYFVKMNVRKKTEKVHIPTNALTVLSIFEIYNWIRMLALKWKENSCFQELKTNLSLLKNKEFERIISILFSN
jgi:hypothetical protein